MFELEAPPASTRQRTSEPVEHHATTVSEPVAAPLLQALLDRLPAVALLDAAGRLVFWNAAARARLQAAGWTVAADGVLRLPAATDRATLARGLAHACKHDRLQLLAVTLENRRAHLALVPIVAEGRRCAALLLDRETVCGSLEMQLFASSIGLTLAEQRVLAGLARGVRPAQIARQHGVQPSTVRSQAAALRAKAHCTSLCVLLDRVARLPALQALAGR